MNNRLVRQWPVRNPAGGTYGPSGPLVRAALFARSLRSLPQARWRSSESSGEGPCQANYPPLPRLVRGQLIRQRPPGAGTQNNCFGAVSRA